jgi:very-short-patch-repair endonuclease
MSDFLTIGDSAMSSMHETASIVTKRDRTLKDAIDRSGAASSFALDRFRRRWASLGVSAQMTESAIERGQAAINYGVYLCDSPIEKLLLPWLVFEDYGSQVSGPARIIGPEDREMPIADLMIAPQFAFGRYRLDFALLVKDMKGARRIFAIECDGAEYHMDEHADAIRDEYLREWGVTTIRASGSEIYRHPIAVSARVAEAVMDWCGA